MSTELDTNGTEKDMTAGPVVTQDQIDAALRKRPRFKLEEFVPPHVYKAVGFIISLERDKVDRAYAIGIASKMFRIAKEQLRDCMDQVDGIHSGQAELADMIRDFHDQNFRWNYWPSDEWESDQWKVVQEIKKRLNNMLEHLGEETVD